LYNGSFINQASIIEKDLPGEVDPFQFYLDFYLSQRFITISILPNGVKFYLLQILNYLSIAKNILPIISAFSRFS